MNLLKGLKKETIEELAELYENPRYKALDELIHLNIENFGKLCLIRDNIEHIRQLQYYASAFSLLSKTVEDAYRKVNNLPKKRRKK